MHTLNEESLRYFIFTAIKKSPLLLDVKIFPDRVNNIIKMMRDEIIPMKASDIQVNGNDVISMMPSLEGEKIGEILKTLHKHALMETFDWKNREASLKALSKIILNFKK